jgi:hypothetical protein
MPPGTVVVGAIGSCVTVLAAVSTVFGRDEAFPGCGVVASAGNATSTAAVVNKNDGIFTGFPQTDFDCAAG